MGKIIPYIGMTEQWVKLPIGWFDDAWFQISCQPGAIVDSGRLEAGTMPFLKDHHPGYSLGHVLSAMPTGEVVQGEVDIGDLPLANECYAEMAEGARRGVSFGFDFIEVEVVQGSDNPFGDSYRVTLWEPFELSSVTVPQIAKATVTLEHEPHLILGEATMRPHNTDKIPQIILAARRKAGLEDNMDLVKLAKRTLDKEGEMDPEKDGEMGKENDEEMMPDKEMMPGEEGMMTDDKDDMEEMRQRYLGEGQEMGRRAAQVEQGLVQMGRDLKRGMATLGKDIEGVNGHIQGVNGRMDSFEEKLASLSIVPSPMLGRFAQDEPQEYFSFARFLKGFAANSSSADREAAKVEEAWAGVAKAAQMMAPNGGIAIPWQAFRPARQFAIGTAAGSGGNIVPTDVALDEMIPWMRDTRTNILQYCRNVPGIVGNLDLPAGDTIATISTVTGTGTGTAPTEQAPTIRKDTLSPNFQAAWTAITQTLRLQSNYVIDAIVGRDLMDGIMVAINGLVLTTIRGTTGIEQAADYTTAAPTFAQIYELEDEVNAGSNNAEIVNPVYVFQRDLYKKLYTGLIDDGSGLFIVSHGGPREPAMAGYVGPVPSIRTTLLTAGDGLYGDFDKCIVGYWGGLELKLIDNPTNALQPALWAWQACDVGVPQPKFFSRIEPA